MRSATTKSRRSEKDGPRGRERVRSIDAGSALQKGKSRRRLSLLSRPKVRASNEKEESGGDAERLAQTWEAVSRCPRQDRGLGRARFRGRDDVRSGALHGQDGIVLDAADGSRNQGSRPERLENRRLQTTETVHRERNRLAGVNSKRLPSEGLNCCATRRGRPAAEIRCCPRSGPTMHPSRLGRALWEQSCAPG